MVTRRTPAETERTAAAGRVVAAVHEVMQEAIARGVSTLDPDLIAMPRRREHVA